MAVTASLLAKALRNLRKLGTTPERKELIQKAWPGIKQEIEFIEPKRGYVVGSMSSNKAAPADIDTLLYTKGRFEQPFTDIYRPVTPEMEEYPVHIIKQGRMNREMTQSVKTAYHPDDYLEVLSRRALDLRSLRREGRQRYGKDFKWQRLFGLSPLAAALLEEEIPDEGT